MFGPRAHLHVLSRALCIRDRRLARSRPIADGLTEAGGAFGCETVHFVPAKSRIDDRERIKAALSLLSGMTTGALAPRS